MRWFEAEMPNAVTRPLFEAAANANIALSIGYAELTAGRASLQHPDPDRSLGNIVGKYRKVHLPGHSEFDPERAFQHLEKRYFEPGDLGFPVFRVLGGIFGMLVCNDRRWPEAYRVMGLQGVEMIVLGYNTPAVNSQRPAEGPEQRLFHNRLSVQAGAYQNSTFVVAVAKAGDEDGHPLIGGSLIVNPDGEIVAEAKTEGDELLVHACDLDDTGFGKRTIFDFARHRRIEHYGRITAADRGGAAAGVRRLLKTFRVSPSAALVAGSLLREATPRQSQLKESAIVRSRLRPRDPRWHRRHVRATCSPPMSESAARPSSRSAVIWRRARPRSMRGENWCCRAASTPMPTSNNCPPPAS